jgi:hypothetical protein
MLPLPRTLLAGRLYACKVIGLYDVAKVVRTLQADGFEIRDIHAALQAMRRPDLSDEQPGAMCVNALKSTIKCQQELLEMLDPQAEKKGRKK